MTLITLGVMLQPLLADASTQGESLSAWFTTYGLQTILGLAVLLVLGLVVGACRRTKANSRGNEKKF
ncbi:MAG TPA: hypothetical protein VGB94_13335 [Acidobacteriaceae bacterium]